LKTNSSRREGFTLLELLAVVAVLAVLTGFLVPAVARGTMRAKQAACLANQRQIGTAILLYAGEHDGTLPQSTHTTGRRRVEESWIFTLAPYLEDLDEIRICPAESSQRQETIRKQKATSYVVNDLVFDDPTYFRTVAIPYPSRTLLMGILSENRAPSTTGDHIHGAEWTSWKNALQDIEPDRHRLGARSSDRLEGSSNYLFADGHAEMISAKTFKKNFDEGINPAAVPTE
jgi:prepilin-type N-terminal cleavage/methylation domain-containing protein/prepilin-type processing-associated H-X9-DG protein